MPEAHFKNARILIIDDQEANVRLLERILKPAGYLHVTTLTDPRKVLDIYAEVNPDLILLDLHMPYIDGIGVMRQLDPLICGDNWVPILVLTADALPAAKQNALARGAKDFLTKPFDTTEVLLRIHNLLETRFLYLELQSQNQRLEERVQERTREIEQAQQEMLERLARASESRDDDTGRHTQRVSEMSAALARAAGRTDLECMLIRRAAALHDIGKIGIPDHILLKPGKLTSEEFEQIRTHTSIGAGILTGSRFAILQMAEQVALYHHEKWDGSGYYGLSGDSIPLPARIVTIADVFDVLTHERIYKPAWPLEDALTEIRSQSGRMFDPGLVELFLRGGWRTDLLNLFEVIGPQTLTTTEVMDRR
ncbi:MAG TPA: HD domain-containing phosphohydrolase [Bryobacteraceae bacterium]|nr:HD domain-containing phosphohydrolase [Bryobacteraceae bacterium]